MVDSNRNGLTAIITISGGKDSLLAGYIASKQFKNYKLVHVKQRFYPEQSEYLSYIEELLDAPITYIEPTKTGTPFDYLKTTPIEEINPTHCCGLTSGNGVAITKYIQKHFYGDGVCSVYGRCTDDMYSGQYEGIWHKGQVMSRIKDWEFGYTYYPIWNLSRADVLRTVDEFGLLLNPVYERYSKCSCVPCASWWTQNEVAEKNKNLNSLKEDYPERYKQIQELQLL